MVEAIQHHIGAVKSTAEGSPNLTAFLFDVNLNLVICEGPVIKKLGEKHFITGKHISEAIPSEFAERFTDNCKLALKGQNSAKEKHEGDNYYVESFIPMPLEDGTYNVLVISRNLSDLQLFKSMQDSKRQIDDILATVNDVLFKTLLDGTITFVSQSCQDVFGYTKEELLNTKISGLYVNPDEREQFLAEIKKNGRVDNFSLKMRTKSGVIITTSATSTIRKDSNNDSYLYCTVKDISDQILAKEKLNERNQLFKNLYHHSGMPIAFTYPDGTISMANQKMCEFLGYTEEELTKFKFSDISFKEDADKELQYCIEIVENKRDLYELEKRYITKSGELKWGKATVSAVRKSDGTIDYMMGAVTDIDSSKKATLELKNSEKKFRNIFHNNGLAIYIVNTNGVITMCNEGMEELLGYPSSELIGASVNKITFKDDIEKVVESVKDLYNGLESVTIKKRYVTKNKKVIIGELTMSLFHSPDSDTTQTIGVVKDITNEALVQEALKLSEEKFRKAFENNGLAVAITNKKGEYLMCNKGMEDFVGYPEDELKLKTTFDLSIKEDLEPVKKELQRLSNGEVSSVTVRKRYVTKSGQIKWGDLTVSLLTETDKELFLGVVKDITEQIQIERALKSSEERFRKIFENNAIGIATANTEGYYTLCNDGFCNILGYTKDELYKLKSVDVTHPDDVDITSQFIEDIFSGKIKSYNAVKRYITKSGKTILGEISVSAFTNPDNGELTLVGVLDDITEKKNAELALKESEEKFRKIFENNGLGVAIVNMKGEYQLINKGAEKILGYTSEEIRGKTNIDITHPDDKEVTTLQFEKLIRGEIAQYDLVKRYITKSGKAIWGDITVSIMELSSQEEPLLIGVMHDITEQKEVEGKLKTSEERFRKIFENNGLAVLVVDSEGQYVLSNKGTESILGYSREEFLKLKNIDITHPDDYKATEQKFKQLIAGEIEYYNLQKRYITKQGNTIWGDITVSHMGLSEGGKPLFIGVIHDITEQKKAEQEIKVTNKELKILSDELIEQNSQLENFAHITSHNLRGPLSNLIMLSDVYTKTDADDTKEELVKKFRSETERMLKTLDILAEQIHTRKKASVVRERLIFSKVYEDTIESLSELIDASSAILKTDFKECKLIEYPKTYLDSIFLNLISNAIKYRSPDRIPEIHVRTYKKDNKKYLEIKDNGLGIDLERSRDKLFGLYKTFHNHPEARGVGLFLIRSQVESLGGSIHVDSIPKKGTTFTIQF